MSLYSCWFYTNKIYLTERGQEKQSSDKIQVHNIHTRRSQILRPLTFSSLGSCAVLKAPFPGPMINMGRVGSSGSSLSMTILHSFGKGPRRASPLMNPWT
ncbi:hypothetical protein HYQ44_016257 [Verticillium longisporum]|nr:hypothetical protein HYQ44_016257 [Verticillium longisporum]